MRISMQNCSLSVSSETVQPMAVIRDLSVLLDSQLTMKQHTNKVTATTNYGACDKSVDVLDQKLQSSWCWHSSHLG